MQADHLPHSVHVAADDMAAQAIAKVVQGNSDLKIRVTPYRGGGAVAAAVNRKRAEFGNDIVGRLDQLRALPNQLVATPRQRIMDRARYREHLAPLVVDLDGNGSFDDSAFIGDVPTRDFRRPRGNREILRGLINEAV